MRIGWHVHLLGPFGIGGTVWRSKPGRKGPVYHGKLPGGRPCPHDHRRLDTAEACAGGEAAGGCGVITRTWADPCPQCGGEVDPKRLSSRHRARHR